MHVNVDVGLTHCPDLTPQTPDTMAALEEYEWILVLGAIAALFAAFGIGANDVANAWATCVGARSLVSLLLQSQTVV